MTDETTLTLINNAVPYISNLVWVIGQQSLDLDQCLTGTEADYKSRGQVEFYMAEHLDHFHYLNDVRKRMLPTRGRRWGRIGAPPSVLSRGRALQYLIYR